MVQLLRPGGAMQWIEPDTTETKSLRGMGSVRPPVAVRSLQTAFDAMCGDKKWLARKLPSLYEANGLRDVFQDQAATDRDPEVRSALTNTTYKGMLGWARLQQDEHLPGTWTSAELDELARRCEMELAAGVYMRYEICITIGFSGSKDDKDSRTPS